MMSTLAQSLRSRKTEKVLADPANPFPVGPDIRGTVDSLLADAARAPFHFPSDKSHWVEMDSPVPWRFYKVDTADCRKLMSELSSPERGAGKIANMLAAADALIQVTWLPDPPADLMLATGSGFEGTQRNMEHIAAASCAVHALLLLATERGYKTYWSSGGVLRTEAVFERLAMPLCEKLLGSVFLYPQDVGDVSIKPGLWHDKRGQVTDWSAWRTL